MSYHQHQPDSSVPAMIVVGVVVVVLGLAAALSNNIAVALGANFWIVFYAIGHMALGLLLFDGAVIAAFYFEMLRNLGCAIALFFAMTASVVWWCFGTVLDSMALHGQDPASDGAFYYGGIPWWDSWWFQWGGSGVLLICVVLIGLCALSDR